MPVCAHADATGLDAKAAAAAAASRPSFCGCVPRRSQAKTELDQAKELDQATDFREESNSGVDQLSFRKLFGNNEIVGSFRKSTRRFLAKGKKSGPGAALVVAPFALAASNAYPAAAPAAAAGRGEFDQVLFAALIRDQSPRATSTCGNATSNDVSPRTTSPSEADEVLPSILAVPPETPNVLAAAHPDVTPAADPDATSAAIPVAIPVATPAATPTVDPATVCPPAALPAAVPAATPALISAEGGGSSSGDALGSPPVEPARTRRTTKERLQTWARSTFDLGGTELSHTKVPVVEWDSLVGHRFLGSGEFCTVSSATLDGAPVAVKVLREVQRNNNLAISDLESEAQIMISLRHRSIVRVLGVGRAHGLPFLVLEVLDTILLPTLPKPAGQVSVWVRRCSVKQWPLRRALQCGIELSEALRYCHDEAIPSFQLLHRDIKPDNVGFRADGSLVLFDFGLAKLVRTTPQGVGGTEAHKLTGQTGAVRYMAPEVASSQPYGTSAEVYSFSIILWQLVSHEVPYSGMNAATFHRRVVVDGLRPPLSKAWPAPLSRLLAECWSCNPTERPAMEDVGRRLRDIHDALKP